MTTEQVQLTEQEVAKLGPDTTPEQIAVVQIIVERRLERERRKREKVGQQ